MKACYNLCPTTSFNKCSIESHCYRRLVASEDIKRGEVILIDECVLSLTNVFPTNSVKQIKLLDQRKETICLVNSAIEHKLYPNTLSDIRREYKRIYPKITEDISDSLVDDSSYRCLLYLYVNEFIHEGISRLFLNASAINSSCSPNCIFAMIDNRIFVQSISDIAAGSEITIAYSQDILVVKNRDERRALIKENYGFDCRCEYCNTHSTKARCIRCGRSDVDILKCSRCKDVLYCSTVCQTDHWSHHQNECR